jgi:FecR-like protein
MIRNRVSLLAPMSFLLALGLGVVANAQYLISTKAGFVNRVEGEVYILRAADEDGEKGRASLGTQMRAGDRLNVAANGFAETLLNPGSYLRLSENTEIRAVNIDFDSVRFELIKGSVIVEVGQVDKKTPIEIVTPHGALTIAKAGLSRIDAKGSATLVSVRQGEIHMGTRDYFMTNQSLKIKRGKVVTLTGPAWPGPSDIAKLDRDAIDKFDTWSFNRAQALTAANVRALSRTGTLTAGWYYDQFSNFYTFVPSRSWFWSPYGFGFFNNYRDCHSYTPYYNSGGNYRGQGGNASDAQASPRVVSGNDRGAVSRSTDRRSVDMGYGSRSGGSGNSGWSRGDSSSPSSSGSRATPSFGGASRESGGQRGGGAAPSRGGGAAPSRGRIQ